MANNFAWWCVGVFSGIALTHYLVMTGQIEIEREQ
ncbi:hypothetical protein J4T94_gp092 [Mycobacterium phage Krypton555]|uniref:Uncharacterized protein n=1 Tax=Mycobacterium phage Krypton555 TaxID=2015885 RepID=A0A222ZQV9_9CAUD|nr:hypothetical protein J4T94_gp092 [Mycobacterium phage Krypton555]ASR87126.1 hypothetical protein KRYPTON555_90 [Mycobacterium phage Krypton555]